MRQSFRSLHAKSSKSGRGKTLFDEEKVGGACCVRHGEASISVSVSDESRTLSPARHFSPAIAARFYSSLLCLFVPPRINTSPDRASVHTDAGAHALLLRRCALSPANENLPSRKNEPFSVSHPTRLGRCSLL